MGGGARGRCRRHKAAGPALLVRRCWSGAGCVLFVATQQMFLPLSRLPFVPPYFLLLSFVLCVVVVVFVVLFCFPSFSNSRAAGIVRLFVPTVSVTRQSCFVGLVLILFFFSVGWPACERRGSPLFTAGAAAAQHVQIWPLTCGFFQFYYYLFIYLLLFNSERRSRLCDCAMDSDPAGTQLAPPLSSALTPPNVALGLVWFFRSGLDSLFFFLSLSLYFFSPVLGGIVLVR